ncbi:MAG: universal stress protein [Cytophagales bacterium]|nr:universal stress protein [Cytophagales bacterium]
MARYRFAFPAFLTRAIENYELRTVVFATSFDDLAEPLLLLLGEWQQAFGFHLHLLYVNTPARYATTPEIDTRVEKFLKKYPVSRYTTAVVDAHSVREGIAAYTTKTGADLVALATYGRDGLARLLGGSLTEEAVNHLSMPVLAYNIHTHEQYCL